MKILNFFNLILTIFLALFLSSCSVIGDIFKTGMGVGIFIAVAVVAIVVVIIMKTGKKS